MFKYFKMALFLGILAVSAVIIKNLYDNRYRLMQKEADIQNNIQQVVHQTSRQIKMMHGNIKETLDDAEQVYVEELDL